MTAIPEVGAPVRDTVTLRLPADGAYLAVLRTAAAGLASRLNFTLDDIEDLRIAVDEACAMLLPKATDAAMLECSFELKPGLYAINFVFSCWNSHNVTQGPGRMTLLAQHPGETTLSPARIVDIVRPISN